MWFYIDGNFVQDDEAKIPITDRSFLYGDGCFEGIGVYKGRIPHLDDHIARMFRSARMLRIEMPVRPETLGELIIETAALNGMAELESAYLRPLVSRGSGPLGVKNTLKIGPPILVIIPQISERRALFGNEVAEYSVAITRYVRPGASSLDPGIKSNNYLTSILAFLEAQERGADVAILRDQQGFLSECHAMNLFCVQGSRVLTPMSSAALRGITRANVLRVASQLGLECQETNLTDYDLVCSDEAFVTSSLESLAAIASVDDQPMKGEVPGPITMNVREAYNKYAWETGTEIPKKPMDA